MAYKFQLGTAKLSGSIQLTDGSIDSTDVDDTTAANIVAQIDAGEIAIAKLAESTISGKALGDNLDALTAGNGISMSSYDGSAAVSDLAIQRSGSAHALKLDADGLAVLLSGSTGLAIDASGLKLSAVPNASLANDSVDFGGVELALGGVDATPAFNLSDATDYPTTSLVGTITNTQLSGAIENAKLVNDSVSFGGVSVDLGASDATPAFDLSDATAYRTSALVGTITNTQLSGAIANAKLVNDSVDFGGVELALGGVDATPAFNLSDATAYPGDSSLLTVGALDAGSISSGFGTINVGSSAISGGDITGVTGSFSGDLTVTGDLNILGAVVSASVEQLKIQDALITVGDGDSALSTGRGFEIGNNLASFQVASGSEIGFNFSSSLPLQAGTLVGDSAFIDAWEISSTHISGALPVSASAFYGDGSNLSGVSADNASELDFNIAVLEAAGDIVSRFTKVDSTVSNAFTVTMPLIDADNDGAMFVIKDYTGNCASEAVTIAPSGSQRIEGAAQNIILESGFAAVTMVAVYNSNTNPGWFII